MSDEETAEELEKQANVRIKREEIESMTMSISLKDLNSQFLENRRLFVDLEARLLSGETDRIHQYRAELIDHQLGWKDEMWIIHRQTWM